MSLSLSEGRMTDAPPVIGQVPAKTPVSTAAIDPPNVLAFTAWHSLFWLVLSNAIGVLIATFLLVPSLNRAFGEWTYGRWMPVHMNLQLYGWCSLPLVAFLFKVYGADRGSMAQWCRPALWVWSAALGVGAFSWLNGHSSGKLFLDWTGYSRILFPVALGVLWLILAIALAKEWTASANSSFIAKFAKLVGLALLLVVPALIYIAANPNIYPPINPASGGPTGASQLESALVIIAILLLLPFGITQRKARHASATTIAWAIFVAEFFLCTALGRADVSNHRPVQYISLASLLVWIPLTPLYYQAFEWHPNTRRWRIAFLGWWSILIPTGWCLFLPGMLDHFKFTDGLVGHSLLAMAGFVSALLLFVMVQLMAKDGWIFNGTWSFYAWNIGVFIYVVLMFLAGWREGADPSFTIVPSVERNVIYVLRLLVGVLMFASSGDWLIAASKLLREPTHHGAFHLQDQAR